MQPAGVYLGGDISLTFEHSDRSNLVAPLSLSRIRSSIERNQQLLVLPKESIAVSAARPFATFRKQRLTMPFSLEARSLLKSEFWRARREHSWFWVKKSPNVLNPFS